MKNVLMILTVLVALTGASCCMVSAGNNEVSPSRARQIEDSVRQLKSGASRSEVESLLKDLNIAYSEDENNGVRAMLHIRKRGWSLVRESRWVRLRFDTQGNLVDSVIEPIFTGP